MKLDTLKQQVSVIRGEQAEDTSFGIDGKNMHLAIQAFYQYSDPIGSIIREITSNAWDAHIEAGVQKAVIVDIDTHEKAIRILDFGVGLSPDRVRDIYTKFFSSTKRESNDQIGAFGLGCKSPLSYTDMFQVTTKYGEAIYEYVVHKSDGIPSLVKLGQQPWEPKEEWSRAQAQRELSEGRPRYHWKEHENGTEVVVPFKESDERQILDAARKQLCYFDNVVIMHPKIETYNTEKIHQGNHLIYRQTTDHPDGVDRLHMCVGKVYYPLTGTEARIRNTDLSVLHGYIKNAAQKVFGDGYKEDPFVRSLLESSSTGYGSPIREFERAMSELPMGLYFDIGELPILWHRENIEYTDAAWEVILQRLFEAGMELRHLQKKHIGPIHSLKDGLKAQLAGIGSDGELYMSSKAMQATGTSVRLTDLESFVSSSTMAEPLWFINLLYEAHSDSGLKSPDKRNLARALVKPGFDYNYWRIENGESRKPGLTDYMAAKGMKYVIVPQRKIPQVANKLNASTPAHIDIVGKYMDEFFALLDAKIPQANDIEIPATFKKSPKAATQSEIPILWRDFFGYRNIQYRRDDLKKAIKGERAGRWRGLDTLPSLLVYGHQADRNLLNLYAAHNCGSMLRSRFGEGFDYDVGRPIMGLISKETATYIDQVCLSIYIKDFLGHRRAIANLVTQHLIALYRRKYPWFDSMLKEKDRYSSTFYDLKKQGYLSAKEYNRIRAVVDANPGYLYDDGHAMYEYVMAGLRKRYFHWDELEELRWTHGMLAKFAPVLGSYWVKGATPENPDYPTARLYYYQRDVERIQQHINPILYRKYHVKYIEQT